MENLESEEKETNVNLEEVAKEYAEKLRSELKELKDRDLDPHFKYINPDELTYDDLIIFDKAKKYNLTEDDFKKYSDRLREYFHEQKKLKENDFNILEDSRSNFSAMLRNMLLVEQSISRQNQKNHKQENI